MLSRFGIYWGTTALSRGTSSSLLVTMTLLIAGVAMQAVALKLSPEHFHQVMSPISSRSTPRNDSPNTAYELHEVECIVFEQGDQDKITGKLIASIPIVVDPRYTAPNLMPTLR